MMKLWNKISIHPLTYIMILISLLSGLFKLVLIAFTIVILHELGHIICLIIFKRKINKIIILPFGGLIKIDSPISSYILEDLLISISGISMQLVIGIISILLYQNNIIDYYLYQSIYFYNTIIITFNLIPLCPLDGYKIVKLIEEIIIPYKRTFIYSFFISVLIFISIILFKVNLVKENILVFIFILISTILEYKNRNKYVLRFYLERLNKEYNFNRISFINRIEEMYKNRLHIINGTSEKEYLKKYFGIKSD